MKKYWNILLCCFFLIIVTAIVFANDIMQLNVGEKYRFNKKPNEAFLDNKTHNSIIKYDDLFKDLSSDNESKAKKQKEEFGELLKDIDKKPKAYLDVAKQLSESAKDKKKLDKYIRDVQTDVFNIIPDNTKNMSTNESKSNEGVCRTEDELGNPTLYLFISSSIPETTLKNYVNFAKQYKGKILIVLNGFVGNIEKIRPTIDFLSKLACGKTTKQLTEADKQCDAPRMDINPLLFRAFNIKQVPAFVYSKKSYFEIMMIMNDPNAGKISEQDFYVLYGDVSFTYAIDRFDHEVKGLAKQFAIKK